MRLAVVVFSLALGCAHRIDRKVTPNLWTVDREAPFLKAHMRDGDLYVFAKWGVDEREHRVVGNAAHYGADRALLGKGAAAVAMADVALYETNTIISSPSIAGMAIVTGASIAATIACLANPKACFGSCPTFYAPTPDGPVLQAEGFSDAIAPALETHDIDALWRTRIRDGNLTLRMTNEAYETHIIKQADVLAVPRPPGTRVVSTGSELWLATALAAPLRCTAAEGDCTDALAAVDGRERLSATDEHDLGARETIDLEFPAAETTGRQGIVIASRQTLVTTFLLYQGLAYLGTTAADWLASIERGDPASRAAGHDFMRLVGAIEVQIPHGAGWLTVGETYETGPLATDVHLVLLPPGVTADRVRLRFPRGGWRIDHVGRAVLDHPVTPVRVAPHAIRGTLGTEYAAGRTPATAFPIVTQPGDSYELAYTVPQGDVELFLDSRGYYLEWMRAEWLREEQPLAALRMLLDPARALRDLAPAFKRTEAGAEHQFWSSRYARP